MIRHVYIGPHSIVRTFDEYGNSLPEYTGKKDIVWPKILRDAPPGVVAVDKARPDVLVKLVKE